MSYPHIYIYNVYIYICVYIIYICVYIHIIYDVIFIYTYRYMCVYICIYIHMAMCQLRQSNRFDRALHGYRIDLQIYLQVYLQVYLRMCLQICLPIYLPIRTTRSWPGRPLWFWPWRLGRLVLARPPLAPVTEECTSDLSVNSLIRIHACTQRVLYVP